jgi:hypothetical protein
MGATARACQDRGIAYLTATFAFPDPARLAGEQRRHLDDNAAFWTRRLPMPSYATWAAIMARHNQLLVEFSWRSHVPYVAVHQKLDDPALFIDVCHFNPEGIERLADAFVPAVADLVEDTAAFREWRRAQNR